MNIQSSCFSLQKNSFNRSRQEGSPIHNAHKPVFLISSHPPTPHHCTYRHRAEHETEFVVENMNRYVEVSLSWLLQSSRGHEAKCFHKSPAFASHADQIITVTSPDCGPSPATLGPEYITEGGGRIPALSWTAPLDIESRVKEWLIVVEDPDAPLPTPICHG